MARPHDEQARKLLLGWIKLTLEINGWKPHAWTTRAGISDTSLTRFLKNPDTAPIPAATTIVALSRAALSNPVLIDEKKVTLGRNLPLLDGKLLTLRIDCPKDSDQGSIADELELLTDKRVTVVSYAASLKAFGVEIETRAMNLAGLLPGDHCVVEPIEICPPRIGDTVITLTPMGEIQPMRLDHDWLMPVSSDPACRPVPLGATEIHGTVMTMSRPMRPFQKMSEKQGKEILELV